MNTLAEFTARVTLGVIVEAESEAHVEDLVQDYMYWLRYWTDYQYYFDVTDEDGLPTLVDVTTKLVDITEEPE